MHGYILPLLALCISVFAAKGGGLINKSERFNKVSEGKWLNTSIILQSSDFFSNENLLVNLLALYGNDDFNEFASVVGMGNAIDCLELDTRSSDILHSHFNVSQKLTKRQDVYQFYSGTSRECRNMETWPSWMRCYVATYFSKATMYTCGMVEYIYGTATSPSTYKYAWKMALDQENALGVVGIGLAFKSTDAKECTSSFLVANERFGLVTGTDETGTDEPAFLLGVIPKNKKGANCRTATSESDIDDMATILFREAMKKHMVAFCLTLTGQNGWFGFNNWYGQVKVYPMVDSGTVSYAAIPCLEFTSEGLYCKN